MFIIANILEAIVFVVNSLLSVYSFVVIAACLISFVNPDPYNPIVRIIRSLTEPAFARIRKLMPFVVIQGLDLAPVVLLLAIHVTKIVVIKSLYQLFSLLV